MPFLVPGSMLDVLAALLVSIQPITGTTNSGQMIQGELAEVTQTSVMIDVSGETREYAFDELSSLRSDTAEEIGPTDTLVSLVGGSRIAARSVSLRDGQLLIEPPRQDPLRVPINRVRAIRFRKPLAATDPQWLGILDRDSRGDTLVIRRPQDRLDPNQGVILSIGDGVVNFDLDGDTVPAPIDRLEGVVFGGTSTLVDDAEIQVTDSYGSRWAVMALQPSKGSQPLQMQLTPTITHPLPLHQLGSIRFSAGVALLAEERPASSSFRPYLPTNVDNTLLDRFFGPAAADDQDLVMHGGSTVEYRIQPGYRLLAGSVRRGKGVTDASRVVVRIELDGESVWEQQLTDSQPRGFELSVDQSRRLAIRVEAGEDGSLGDTVHVSRPRLLK